MKFIISFIILATVLAGTPDKDVNIFTEKRKLGKLSKYELSSFKAPKGTKFFVDLPSNPSTGYMWEVHNKDDFENIEYKGDANLVDIKRHKKHYTGTQGRQGFKFFALNKGTDAIEFWYKRPWLTKPSKVYILEIEVK